MSDNNLSLNLTVCPIYSIAFLQNQYPLVSSISLSANQNSKTISNIRVVLSADPDVIHEAFWDLDFLEPGTSSILFN